jgi:hypothetical protein
MTTLVITMVATLVLTSMAFAVDFSANLNQKITSTGRSMNLTGTIYVKGLLQRQDISTPMGKQTVIIRPDKGVMWMVMASQKSYMERPIKKMDMKNPPTVESMLKQMPNFKKIGSEKISGFQCDKYKFNDTTKKISGVVSISPVLKQELKSDVKTSNGTMLLVLSNVKQTTQNMSLFNIPAGYKKMTMPQMGPGMGGAGGPSPAPGGGSKLPPGFGK